MIKNTWSQKAKLLNKKLKFQAYFKVRFPWRNDEMTRMKNF